ncbi:MAG: hypothetical protein WEG36_12365 [Gemmatimonadota bacterium]
MSHVVSSMEFRWGSVNGEWAPMERRVPGGTWTRCNGACPQRSGRAIEQRGRTHAARTIADPAHLARATREEEERRERAEAEELHRSELIAESALHNRDRSWW